MAHEDLHVCTDQYPDYGWYAALSPNDSQLNLLAVDQLDLQRFP